MVRKESFTLIELLVVVSIVVLISAMVLISYRQGERELTLYSEADKLVSIIRTAQADALTGSILDSLRPEHYGICFSEDGYVLFAENDDDCAFSSADDNNFLIQEFSLESGISLIDYPSTIVFSAPEASVKRGNGGCSDLTTPVQIVLFQSATNKQVSIEVNNQGKIEIIK